mgnify:CR=1 FL=1
MRPLFILLVSALGLTGCAHAPGPKAAAPNAAETAAKNRYWAIQEKHRPAPLAEFETIPLARPARTEGGVRYEASTDTLRIPRSP